MQSFYSRAVAEFIQGNRDSGGNRTAANHHHQHPSSARGEYSRPSNLLQRPTNNVGNNKGYDSDETEQPSQIAFVAAATDRASMPAAVARATHPTAASRNQSQLYSSPISTTALPGSSRSSSTFNRALQNSVSAHLSAASAGYPNNPTRDSATTRPPIASPATKALLQLSQGSEHCMMRTPINHLEQTLAAKKKKSASQVSQPKKKRTLDTTTPTKQYKPKTTPKKSVQNANTATTPQIKNTIAYQVPANFADDWDIIPIRIPTTETRSMGIGVIPATFPGLAPQRSNEHCRITRVITERSPTTSSEKDSPTEGPPQEGNPQVKYNSCGAKYGLQPGDWFLQPGYDYTHPRMMNNQATALPRLANFKDVALWSKTKPYATVCVLRQKPSNAVSLPGQQATVAAAPSNKKSSTATTADTSNSKKRKAATTMKSGISKVVRDTPFAAAAVALTTNNTNEIHDTVPFCKRCVAEKNNKSQKPRLHHSWCPKNKFYNNSGADDIMERILQGCKLDCPACKLEYQTGKPVGKGNELAMSSHPKHNAACLKNQARLDKEQEERELRELEQKDALRRRSDENKKKSADIGMKNSDNTKKPLTKKKIAGSTKNNARASKMTQSQNLESKRRLQELDLESSLGSDDEDEIAMSAYRPSQERGGIQALGFAMEAAPPKKKPKSITSTAVKAAPPTKKRESKSESRRSSEADKAQNRARTSQSRNFKRSRGRLVSSRRRAPRSMQRFPAHAAKHKWRRIHFDPWGPEGFVMGDVVVRGPEKGLGHVEKELPSRRYRVDPFEKGSDYHCTHATPEEGFSLITMKRDPHGKIPWGFKIQRDEFGHACLVKSVEANSPASAATWIGASNAGNGNQQQSSALKTFDMLVMINGIQVGGMTEAAVSLELEISGPLLFLAVSRYKHSQLLAKETEDLQRKALRALDLASRDRRIIGWREAGNGIIAQTCNDSSEQNDLNTSTKRSDEKATVDDELNQNPQQSLTSKVNQSSAPVATSTYDAPLSHEARDLANSDSRGSLELDDTDSMDFLDDGFKAWLRKSKQTFPKSAESEGGDFIYPRHTGDKRWYRSYEDVRKANILCNKYVMYSKGLAKSPQADKAKQVQQRKRKDAHTEVAEPSRRSNRKTSPPKEASDASPANCLKDNRHADDQEPSIGEANNTKNNATETHSKSEDDEEDEDSNPWLGCVCGEIHSSQSRCNEGMFWIQCESCMSWYDVNESCIGFSEETAATISWKCEACESGSESEVENDSDSVKARESEGEKKEDANAAASGASLTPVVNQEINDSKEQDKETSNQDQQVTITGCEYTSTALERFAAESLIQFRRSQGSQLPHASTNIPSLQDFLGPLPTNNAMMQSQMDGETERNAPSQKINLKTQSLPYTNTQQKTPSRKTPSKKAKATSPLDRTVETKLRRTSDGCLLPRKPPIRREDGTFAKPVGNPPNGLIWDENEGLWVPKSRRKSSQKHTTPSAASKKKAPVQLSTPQSRKASAKPKAVVPNLASSTKQTRRRSKESSTEAPNEAMIPRVFQIGDLVEVQPHSWTCINNFGGVGYVTDIQIDDEGDRNYQIKYVVGKHFEWCLGKFMSPKSFD